MEIIWGSIDGVGIRETDGDVDETKDEMEGREEAEGEVDGGEEEVGVNVMDGTAEGTPRLGSHGISILL